MSRPLIHIGAIRKICNQTATRAVLSVQPRLPVLVLEVGLPSRHRRGIVMDTRCRCWTGDRCPAESARFRVGNHSQVSPCRGPQLGEFGRQADARIPARPRGCRWDGDSPPSFPSSGTVCMDFLPRYPFGGVVEPSRTIAVRSSARMTWNANTGRQTANPHKPLGAVDVVVKHGDSDTQFAVRGNEACYETNFESREALDGAIEYVTNVLPLVLDLEFLDSPTIDRTHGEVSGVSYGWELLNSGPMATEVTTVEHQEEKLARAWERSLLFNDDANHRLLAAFTTTASRAVLNAVDTRRGSFYLRLCSIWRRFSKHCSRPAVIGSRWMLLELASRNSAIRTRRLKATSFQLSR